MHAPALLAQASDSGSPAYVVAAVVVVGVVLLAYLAIVALRVRDSARRLEALEERLDQAADHATTVPGPPTAVAAEDPNALGARR
ncbi:hypothetical protein [Patulibacter sp. SYSU D01012]|uniref:hypothetical protein n=1 Tax=Patulibacter sp. SYSU D01012 TaxID=2817381 RepID=UPI001B317ED4|nr:hypothetical protein [Patulibacter sp. SYSU D01012]